MQHTNNPKRWPRRTFLKNMAAAGAGLALGPAFSSCMGSKKMPPLARVLSNTIGIDTHNHIDLPFNAGDLANLNIGLQDALKKSGLSGICATFAVDRPELTKEGEPYQRFLAGLDAMDAVLKSNGMTRVFNFSDLKKAHQTRQPIVIQAVEGGHFLEGKLERLEVAYRRGLRVLGLLHDNQFSVPLGDIYTDKPQYGGLTAFGRSVIQECNRLGILVDLTHCSNDAIDDALEVSNKPVFVSHTGLDTQLGADEKMATMMKPRLISKAQAKIVANAGGVIGVWTHLAGSPAAYVQNVRAMVDVAGIDHVCIGTDTKMAMPVGANTRFGQQTNAAWDHQQGGFFQVVAQAMLDAGFTETEIMKIGGGNFCRIFDLATRQ